MHRIAEEDKSLHIYLTNKCNLACPHCYMNAGPAGENELTTGEILQLLTDYRTIAKGSRVTLSGGEPATRTDFEQIVKTASGLGLRVKLLTNGTLFSPERIETLAEYITSVQVSIDGFSEQSNARIRGEKSFERALATVDAFLRHDIETSVAITPPFDLLKEHAADYIRFAKTLSAKYHGKPFVIKFAEELLSGRAITVSQAQNKAYLAMMQTVQQALFGADYEVLSFAQTFRSGAILDNCMFGSLAVNARGDLFYCAHTTALPPIANIRTASFEEIYAASLLAEQATAITNLAPCKDCELRFICGGGCRIEEFAALTNRRSFAGFDPAALPPRPCNPRIKNRFYELMIRSNKYLYAPPEQEPL